MTDTTVVAPVPPAPKRKFITKNRVLVGAALIASAAAGAYIGRSELFATRTVVDAAADLVVDAVTAE